MDKWLRSLGFWGGLVASFLQVVTTNWVLVASVLGGILVGGLSALRDLVASPPFYLGGAAALFILWTIVGIYALVDRRRPRQVQAFLDYRFGLTFEGVTPHFSGEDHPIVSQRGAMQFTVAIRNFSPGPIRYAVDKIDIRIGSRASPKYTPSLVSGNMARGAGRVGRFGSFPPGTLKEFYGKGDVQGSLEVEIVYGPPEGSWLRRLKIAIDMTLLFDDKGNSFGFADNILREEDVPY